VRLDARFVHDWWEWLESSSSSPAFGRSVVLVVIIHLARVSVPGTIVLESRISFGRPRWERAIMQRQSQE
jgi:hypothetical protein